MARLTKILEAKDNEEEQEQSPEKKEESPAKSSTGYVGDIEEQTLKNKNFREVLFTGKHAQLVVMSLPEGEEIGNEVHENVDQFFRIEKGKAKFIFNEKEEHIVGDGDAVIVPAGTYHNVINAGAGELKLYTVYSPPNHPEGTIHKTKAEAEEAEAAKKEKKQNEQRNLQSLKRLLERAK
jgi:mannose-6-phosphate isomerase-like protein (cupin superfamily)